MNGDLIAKGLRALVNFVSPAHERVKQGDRTVALVRDGYTLQSVDDRPPVRRHVLHDQASFLAYLLAQGDVDKTTVFGGHAGAVAVLVDERTTCADEWITLSLTPTPALAAWRKLVGDSKRNGGLSHMALKRFIEDRADDLPVQDLVAAVQNFSYRASVSYEAELSDGVSIGFFVERTDGTKGTAKLPTRFDIRVPAFIGEEASTFSMRIDWDQDGEGKPKFSVEFRDEAEVLEKAAADRVHSMAAALGNGWLVVRGDQNCDLRSWR